MGKEALERVKGKMINIRNTAVRKETSGCCVFRYLHTKARVPLEGVVAK